MNRMIALMLLLGFSLAVIDKGLVHTKPLIKPQSLSLLGAQVTDAGGEKLQQALHHYGITHSLTRAETTRR